MKKLFLVLLFIPFWPEPSHAQGYPTNYELTCPSGSVPISGPTGTSFNPTTGKYRANYCIDPFGNISENVSGTVTFTGTMNCANLNGVRCINPANSAGWAGTDIGGWINSAMANCATSGPNCAIQVAPGAYNFSTPIVAPAGTSNSIICPAGDGALGTPLTNLVYTPATGVAITASAVGAAFTLRWCTLSTSTSTTSQGVLLKSQNQPFIEGNHISGFNGGGLTISGDGISQSTIGPRILNNRIDGYCGSGSYAISVDHAADVIMAGNENYSTSNCATSNGLIADTGVNGLTANGTTNEQGINGLIIRNTNQGGAYGGSPAGFQFMDITLGDASPGGSAVILDSTLGTNPVKFYCSGCIISLAGLNTSRTVVTSTAIGLDIEGGSQITFTSGTVRSSAGWGIKVNTTGDSITISNNLILANNQNNTANIGGILVTANPTHVNIAGNVITNAGSEGGGHQAFGIDHSATTATQFVIISGNDLSTNASNRMNLPAGFSGAAIDAPDYFSFNGMAVFGPMSLPENNRCSLGGGAQVDVFCADSVTHQTLSNYNNQGAFFRVPQIIASGTATMTTAAIAAGACGTTVTVSATNVATTDSIETAFNAAPAGTNAGLTSWPTANNVNFAYCPGVAETPAAATINWRVVR